MPQPDGAAVVVDLAADSVAALGLGDVTRGSDPPYPVQFELRRENRPWPAVRLILEIAGRPVAVIDTTEPRLKAALGELMGGLS